jgi:protein-tyrosine phosphatase
MCTTRVTSPDDLYSCEDIPFQRLNDLPENEEKYISRGIFKGFLQGIKSSRILKATVFTGISVSIFITLASNPAGWAIASAASSALITSLIAQIILTDKGLNKISFEITAIMKLLNPKNNYHKVFEDPSTGNKIYLGSLPNRFNCIIEKLRNKKYPNLNSPNEPWKRKPLSVISVNETWERQPLGLSLPYSDNDYDELDVMHIKHNVEDHTFLTCEQLDKIADDIHEQLQKGNVFVHCRAGKGRSSQGVAAELMKNHGFKVIIDKNDPLLDPSKDVVIHIQERRKIATIAKKLISEDGTLGLIKYQEHLDKCALDKSY